MVGRWCSALLAMLMLGCGGPLPTATPTPVPTPPPATATPTPGPSSPIHATGNRDVVLRMWLYNGLAYPPTVERPPEFTLYGDGHVVYTILGGYPSFEMHHAQLGANQVDSLLSDALGPGGLATARPRYEDVAITDLTWTNFEIHAGGTHKTVAVYALGDMNDDVPIAAARAGFKLLANRLGNFAAEVAAGDALDLGAYQPAAYAATLHRSPRDLESNAEWPWPDLAPDSLGRPQVGDEVRGVLTFEQGQAVIDLGITQSLVAIAPDGFPYLIQIRPMLPEELAPGSPATTR